MAVGASRWMDRGSHEQSNTCGIRIGSRTPAWMFVSETDGRLAGLSEDAIFPEGGAPARRRDGRRQAHRALSGIPTRCTSTWSTLIRRTSTSSLRWARWSRGDGGLNAGTSRTGMWSSPRTGSWPSSVVPRGTTTVCVCGGGDVPDTDLVQGRDDVTSWLTNESHCGKFVHVPVLVHRYYPWRLLNIAADTLTEHFGHSRGRIKWKLSDEGGGLQRHSRQDHSSVELCWRRLLPLGRCPRVRTCAAPQGAWRHLEPVAQLQSAPPRLHLLLPVRPEGGLRRLCGHGRVGWLYENCLEHFGTTQAHRTSCRNVSHDRKPEIEGWVAAFFMDLIDDTEEEGDYTEYPGLYVAQAFKTCEKKFGRLPWNKRKRVSDIVWCMEKGVTPSVHEEVFPRVSMPSAVRRDADEPDNWRFSDFRLTWRKNLSKTLH